MSWLNLTLKRMKIARQEISRLIKELDPHEAYGFDDVSPHVLNERTGTLDVVQEVSGSRNSVKRE